MTNNIIRHRTARTVRGTVLVPTVRPFPLNWQKSWKVRNSK